MRAVGILGGEGYPNGELLLWVNLVDFYAIADGGIKYFKALNSAPLFVIGDIDSEGHMPETKGFKYIKVVDQNSSDCDKLLFELRERGFNEVILVCGHGGRLDHQLDILNSLARNSFKGPIIYPQEIVYVLSPGYYSWFNISLSTRVSLLPMGVVKLNSYSGFEWDIPNKSLNQPDNVSLSNRTVQNSISLEIESGYIVMTIERKPGEVPSWFS